MSDAIDRTTVPPTCPSWCDGNSHGREPVQLHETKLASITMTDVDEVDAWLSQHDDATEPDITLCINDSDREAWLEMTPLQAASLQAALAMSLAKVGGAR